MASFKDLMHAFLYEEVDDDDDEYEEEEAEDAGFTVTTESIPAPGAPASQQVPAANQGYQQPYVQPAVQPNNYQQPAAAAYPQNAAPYQQPAAVQPNPYAASPQQNPYAANAQPAYTQQPAAVSNPASPSYPASYLQQQASQLAQQTGYAPADNQPALQPASNSSFGLDIREISSEGKKSKEERSPYRYDRRKLQTVRKKQETTEYQSVLSPIFGNMQDEEKSFDAVHDAINLPKPDEEEEMTTIISPMYGSRRSSGAQPQPVQEPIRPKRKKAAPSKEEKQGPRDLADYLTKEPIAIPRPENQKEDEQ